MRMRNKDLRKRGGPVAFALPSGRAPPQKRPHLPQWRQKKARPTCSDVGPAITDQSPPVSMIVMHRC